LTKLRYEFWILPVFAGAALAYAAWLQEPVLWFLTYLSLLCAVLILVYKWRDWRGIEIVRTFRTRQQILEAGSEVRVMLVAKVSSYLPWPWLGVRDNVPADLADKVMGRPGGNMVWAWRGGARYVTYSLRQLPRGIFYWRSVFVQSGDPFGMVTYENQIWTDDKLVVYPRTVPLNAFSFFPRRLEGTVARKAVNQGEIQLAGVREYKPGDRLSLIHWKATAKTNELHSKEFDPLMMSSSLVVLDCSAEAWGREGGPDFEEAVSVAASLVKAALLQRIPVRFYSNFSEHSGSLRVSNRAEYFYLLLHLAGIAPTGKVLYSQALYRDLALHNSNIVIVTAKQGQSIGEIMYRISGRGNAVTVIQVGAGKPSRPWSGPGVSVVNIAKADDLSLHRTGEVL